MIENAVHITNLKNLNYFQKDKFQRIYWGVEFCQNLIPALEDTEKILDFTKKNGLKFTFVTPFVTQTGLEKLITIFSYLKEKGRDCEIVINDWGVLEYLHSELKNQFSHALGRLLVRHQRDPGMLRVLEKQPPFAIKGKDGKIRIILHHPLAKKYQIGVKASYINSPLVQSLLSKFGIKRIEFNNLVQGLNLDGIKLKKSLYVPYVNISTTRFCPMNSKYQRIYRINACKRECQKYYDTLRNRALPKVIYKRGNTTFYKNPLDTKNISALDIDRVVYELQIPF